MVYNKLDLICVVLWTRLRVTFNAYVDPLFEIPSDLLGVNPATNDRMILYYCLMTKVDGLLGDSTVFSWAGCHNHNLSARGSAVFCLARRGLIYISSRVL
jgi:hypothetical protein